MELLSSSSGRDRSPRHLASAIAGIAIALACVCGMPLTARAASTAPVYRLLNIYTGEHLLTGSWTEYRKLEMGGWCAEGVSFRSHPGTGTPVYRLFNPSNSDHLYTTDMNEYARLQNVGWNGEDVCFYGVDPSESGAKPVYRLYNRLQTANGGLGAHHWTLDATEYDALPATSGGAWEQEGIKWYGLPDDSLSKAQGYWVCNNSQSGTVCAQIKNDRIYYTIRNSAIGEMGSIGVAPFTQSPIASMSGSGYEVAVRVMGVPAEYSLTPQWNNMYLFDSDPTHLYRWVPEGREVYTKTSRPSWVTPR